MEENKTLFHTTGAVFTTYGVIVVIFLLLNLILGDAANGYSSLFAYGRGAFSTGTLAELFVLSLLISVCRSVLLTDRWIRTMSMLKRNILFFLTVTVFIVIFVIAFQWFPLQDPLAWVGFIVSFAVCSALGVLISRLREKAENEKMNRALEQYRAEMKKPR